MKTTKITKVLIALDYDPTAQKVAEVGLAFANAMGAEVTLLHVILDPVNFTSPGHVTIMGFAGYVDATTLQLDDLEGLTNAAQHFLNKVKHHLKDNNIKTIVREGDYAECILKAAKDLHSDVIVIGSHSRKWLENIVMGSVTEKVLRHTSIPLFIIPTKKHN